MKSATVTCFLLLLSSPGCAEENGVHENGPSLQLDVGGGQSDSSAEPVAPGIQVKLEPEDLTTSTRFSAMQIRVGMVERKVPGELLNALSKAVSLRVVATGSTLPVTVEVVPSDELGLTRIISITTPELPSEWLEMTVDLSGLEAMPYHSLVPNGDGTYKSRFHPDAVPVLKGARVCFDSQYPGNVGVIVTLSEEVDFVPMPSTIAGSPIAVDLGSGSCGMLSNIRDGEPDKYASVFQFACTGVKEPTTLALSFKRNLATAEGTNATMYSSSTALSVARLSLGDAYTLAECKLWHMP